MGIVKTTYKEEVWQWLVANPSEVYDKYMFIKVFVKVWECAAKVEHTINLKGFQQAGIFLLNPQKVKTGKLAPGSIYQKQEQLLTMDEGFTNDRDLDMVEVNVPTVPVVEPNILKTIAAEGNSGNEANTPDVEPQLLTSQVVHDLKEEFKKPMVIVIGKKRYKLSEVDDNDENKEQAAAAERKTMINDILKVPEVNRKKNGRHLYARFTLLCF